MKHRDVPLSLAAEVSTRF